MIVTDLSQSFNPVPKIKIKKKATRASKTDISEKVKIVTLCTELTVNKCHRKYDFGTKEEREEIKKEIRNYLKKYYGDDWKEENLIYKKYKG